MINCGLHLVSKVNRLHGKKCTLSDTTTTEEVNVLTSLSICRLKGVVFVHRLTFNTPAQLLTVTLSVTYGHRCEGKTIGCQSLLCFLEPNSSVTSVHICPINSSFVWTRVMPLRQPNITTRGKTNSLSMKTSS